MTQQVAFARRWTLADGHEIAVEQLDVAAELARVATAMQGPVLHVGAKQQVIDREGRWAELLSEKQRIGLDLEPGPGVDVVADIAGDVATLRRKAGYREFGAIVCCHVLEHVPRPWDAARNLQFLLRPGGVIVLTVPWVQGWHGFPTDYWRMSLPALRLLFDRIEVDSEWYSGAREDVGYRLWYDGRPWHGSDILRVERNLFQLLHEMPSGQRAFDDREGDKLALSRIWMPACAVNLVGRRRA